MLKHFLLYSFFIVSTIQCSEESTYLNLVDEMIKNKTHLQMIITGIAETYAKTPWFEKHKAEFKNLKTQANPLIDILPEIEQKLASYKSDHSQETLCFLMMTASRDFDATHKTISAVCRFQQTLHKEYLSNCEQN